VTRRVVEEYSFRAPDGTPYIAPKDSVIVMSQWVTHRDARWFENPTKFDPERWTPEAENARPKFSYYPFGSGPRICIGEGFAWMEGVLLIATLAQKWKMRLAPNQRFELQPLITLRPKYGVQVTLQKR
jgi:cytochrome P450